MSRIDLTEDELKRLTEILRQNRQNKDVWTEYQNRDKKGRFAGNDE